MNILKKKKKIDSTSIVVSHEILHLIIKNFTVIQSFFIPRLGGLFKWELTSENFDLKDFTLKACISFLLVLEKRKEMSMANYIFRELSEIIQKIKPDVPSKINFNFDVFVRRLQKKKITSFLNEYFLIINFLSRNYDENIIKNLSLFISNIIDKKLIFFTQEELLYLFTKSSVLIC